MRDRWYGDMKVKSDRWYDPLRDRWYGDMKNRWYSPLRDRWYGCLYLGGWRLCQFRRCVVVMELQVDGLVFVVWADAGAREVLTKVPLSPTQ